MPDFFTDENGVVHPLTGKKSKSGAVVALAAAGVIAVGGGAATGGAGAAVSAGSSTGSGAAQAIRARTKGSKDSARKGRHDEAWHRMSWKTVKRLAKQELRCGPYSYGEVQQFFVRNPCRSLDRMLVHVTDDGGNKLAVMVTWVRMPKTATAQGLRRLADEYGTGCVTPLPGAPKPTGQHYKSRRSGALVVIAEAEPVGGRPSREALDAATDIAVLFPPP
ncbi:hypothetical protein LWC34_48755 [Kibdelosporangium philippinense]|uniref:Secreted protein n=2 Tax=Kibdelosporangium philippinense TaxID=211113 RepID=A0ABS8ZST4_9PSEU|nr:hypothetical protein [Kibdelosporangium philippinense]MCE7010644.1 hypothetical protein [Kibdelosporangium philippinense]